MALDRRAIPPSNEGAEQALLGSALLDRSVIARVADRLAPRDFYQDKHGVIYQAMLDIEADGQVVDYLTVLDVLDRSGRLAAIGGATYLAGLPLVSPTPVHAEQYAELIANAAFMRRLISAGGKIATLGYDNRDDPETALVRCEQFLADAVGTTVSSRMIAIADALSTYSDALEALTQPDLPSANRPAPRLSTGYRDLNEILRGGFTRGDLILLAGRPGMGKSALGFALLMRLALLAGARGVLFSLEMGVTQVLARMLATASGVPLARQDDGQLSPSQQVPFGKALGDLAQTRIMLDDTARLSIATLRSRVRRLVAEREGLDVVVVDHVQLLSGQSRNRVEEIGEISRGLKAIAREHNVAVLALAQLSRSVEQRTDKVPQLSDLRESGTLEQDADVVLMLYREEYYKPETERSGMADLFVAKHRNGRTGRLTLIWNQECTSFRGLEEFGV